MSKKEAAAQALLESFNKHMESDGCQSFLELEGDAKNKFALIFKNLCSCFW